MSSLNDVAQNLPDKPKTLIRSSSVIGYSYDPFSYQLDVWYRFKHGNSLYRYFLVYPPMISQIFDSGPSVGKKARQMLKGLRYIKLG